MEPECIPPEFQASVENILCLVVAILVVNSKNQAI